MLPHSDNEVQLIPSELSTLATEINSHHSQAFNHAKSAMEHARQVGELLTQAKSLVPHGEWLPWLEANCEVSARQAQRYIQVSSNWTTITKNDTVSYLTFRGLSELLADDSDEQSISTTSTVVEYEDIDHAEPPPQSNYAQCADTTVEQSIITTSTEVEYDDFDPEPPSKPHVSHNSGDNEWYTPAEFIEAARAVMSGIDLDPASSKTANKTVKAKRFYAQSNNGLSKKWKGTVWLNPPYAQPLIGQFIEKLVDEYVDRNVTQAIVLTNNATETKWFQTLLSHATAVCFPSSRIKFLDESGEPVNQPLQGQAICYLGSIVSLDNFCAEFSPFGKILCAGPSQ